MCVCVCVCVCELACMINDSHEFVYFYFISPCLYSVWYLCMIVFISTGRSMMTTIYRHLCTYHYSLTGYVSMYLSDIVSTNNNGIKA